MNILKKVAAILLVGALLFSLSACHPKNETAMTIGDVKITSAFYMCSLINATMEARSKVDEALNAEKEGEDAEATATKTETDYFKQKIEDKTYEQWIKDTALKACKQYAAYVTLCKESKIELDDDAKAEIENYVAYYWNYYGYSAIYEGNGVSKATFQKNIESSYLASKYFDSLYGKEGTKAVPEADVLKTIDDNFVIADTLTKSLADLEDAQAEEETAKFKDYAARLKKGESFETIYEEVNGTDSSAQTESDEPMPKNKYATLYGSEETSYSNDAYEKVREMTIDEVNSDVTGEETLTITVRRDLMGDSYWTDTLYSSALSIMKQDEFNKDIEKFADDLKIEKNNYAIRRFKIKKINLDGPAQ